VHHEALLPPARSPSPWRGSGLTARQEKIFRIFATSLVVVMLGGWVASIAEMHLRPDTVVGEDGLSTRASAPISRTISNSILDRDRPTTPFIDEAALKLFDPLRGESGALEAAFALPGSTVARPPNPDLVARYSGARGEAIARDFRAPQHPGIYKVAVGLGQITRPVRDLSVITLVPFEQKTRGRIGTYMLGSWPYETGGTPRSARYANPSGFIEVTLENRDTHVSEHFRLRDFLTKDQGNVWPKYLLLDPKLLDKLELTIQELKRQGYDVKRMTVMSGFRTPRYNHSGGNTAGRANLSRHIYGDAADVFVDNDQNGWTDDVDRDGKVTLRDTEIVSRAAEKVEREHPSLVGGIGTYSACCGHGPFTHVDVRGYRARWRGSGNG
jgi:uncharacterized protein YcbK (DUF882 family)